MRENPISLWLEILAIAFWLGGAIILLLVSRKVFIGFLLIVIGAILSTKSKNET